MSGDRGVATAAQRRGECALGNEPRERFGVMQGLQRSRLRVSSSRHSMPMTPWPTAGSDNSGSSCSLTWWAMPESFEAGTGEQDRIELAFVEPAQPRVDIAAQQLEPQVGTRMAQLCLASRAGRADARALRQVGESGDSAAR